jgi:hypothetical protein
MIFKKNKDKINEFIEYDYVGAPWSNRSVGNGGLSLRRKSKMLEIISIFGPKSQNEDVYFSLQRRVKLNKPNFEKAKSFSVESVFFKTPFGVHNPWAYLKDKMLLLIEEEESLKTLISLQGRTIEFSGGPSSVFQVHKDENKQSSIINNIMPVHNRKSKITIDISQVPPPVSPLPEESTKQSSIINNIMPIHVKSKMSTIQKNSRQNLIINNQSYTSNISKSLNKFNKTLFINNNIIKLSK